MAKWCQQCLEMNRGRFAGRPLDLSGLVPKQFIITADCEGCGQTQVDYKGRCVNPYHKHFRFRGRVPVITKNKFS